ncbi:sensor histidine kinase [Actinomadura hibisca]|uniref:sensor histidine kinase n=1 Tax=Actinomadura hibisca TaxID=68565 RepID=UPI000833D1ED|nr:sensor histidine kinase [Actinomadura hibisca]
MNEPAPAPTPLDRLRDGVHAAVVPRSGESGGYLLPAQPLLMYGTLAVLVALTVGFTAGSIAILIHAAHLSASLAWPLGAAMAAPLVFAVRWPLSAWRVSAAGFLATVPVVGGEGFWPWPVTAFLALLVILFFVGVSVPRTTVVGVGTVTVGTLALAVLTGMPSWFAMILGALAVVTLVFGDAVGGRYSLAAIVAQQAEQLRQDLARQAVLEERARIARELHDVVAHHMSVIAMQAEAAPYKIPDLPDAARQTFGVVRDAAREALIETRRVVGLLRSDDEGAERAPQPGLDRLEELVSAARGNGAGVTSTVVGVPREVSVGVDLSAYRIVQESLSNAARYAPGSDVAVQLRYGTAALTVTVTDGGARTPPEESPGGGHGLVGMRERVSMLGGTLEAGPHGDGWRVRAELPYGDAD